MADKNENFSDLAKHLTPENIGVIGGAMAGNGVGNVIDWYVGPMLAGAAQDLVWLVAPPVGMVLGAVVGYKLVRSLIKEKDRPENETDMVKK